MFWRWFFLEAKRRGIRVIALVGNHDQPGDGRFDGHAMMAHEHLCTVVWKEVLVEDGVVFVPWTNDKEAFVYACNSQPATGMVVCHQSFVGSRFENGYYDPAGIDPNLIVQRGIISGHIHTPQEFGKVWHIGAPRWRIATDANVERAIWLVTHNKDGSISEKNPIDTGSICRQVRYLIDTPSDPVQITLDPRHDWRVDIKGPLEWCKAREGLYGPGVRVRTFPESTHVPQVRESEGIDQALVKYVEAFTPPNGTERTLLRQMVKERLHV